MAGLKDTAFMKNREEPLHQWVPWVAGFSAAFVDDILQTRAPVATDSVTVLDPFSGVGTTLVEAIRHGFNAVGFEINPYAALASRVKVECIGYDLQAARKAVDRFYDFMDARARDSSRSPRSVPPAAFRSRSPSSIVWETGFST